MSTDFEKMQYSEQAVHFVVKICQVKTTHENIFKAMKKMSYDNYFELLTIVAQHYNINCVKASTHTTRCSVHQRYVDDFDYVKYDHFHDFF